MKYLFLILCLITSHTFAKKGKSPNEAPRVITNDVINNMPGPGSAVPMMSDPTVKMEKPAAETPPPFAEEDKEKKADLPKTGLANATTGDAASAAATTGAAAAGGAPVVSIPPAASITGKATDNPEAIAAAKAAAEALAASTTAGGHGHHHTHAKGEKHDDKEEEKK